MVALRWIAGPPVAALITGILFLFMASMISQPIGELPAPKPPLDIKIAPETVDSPDPQPKPPRQIEEKQPPIEIQKTTSGEKPTLRTPGPDFTPTEIGPTGGGNVVVAPVIRVTPTYPERCRSRGAEGDVLVQFDVAADGSVINPRIIESSDSCFNRSVLKTVSGWKYPPTSQGGKPAPRYGLVERFSFQITEE